jgi:hypothetical protein
MLVWINLYFIIYTLLILSLHYILNKIYRGDFNTRSLVFAHFYVIKYSKIKNLYLSVLVSLAGLPPFLLFFIKSNYIISFIASLSLLSNLIIFFSYFVNMLYYTQMFLYKNYIFDDVEYMNLRTEPYDMNIIYKILMLLLITGLGVIFAPDIFFVATLFFY